MRIYNLTDNDDAAIVAQQGIFQVMEWKRDFSVTYGSAMDAYYASEMNVRRRQLVCNLNGKTGAVVQAGAMQWTVGHVEVTTGVKGVGDFIGKLARGAVTNESAVKPEYVGNGVVVLEPTYRHVLLLDPSQMGGAITVNDGLFYACETTIQQRAVMVSRPSAMMAGGEGLFNLSLMGQGTVALESPVPASEIVTVDLENDELKVDGNFAIAWTNGLQFTVDVDGLQKLFQTFRGKVLCLYGYQSSVCRRQRVNGQHPKGGSAVQQNIVIVLLCTVQDLLQHFFPAHGIDKGNFQPC